MEPKIGKYVTKEGILSWENVNMLPKEIILDVKTQFFQYKILQDILFHNSWLNKCKMLGDNLCTFCKTEAENKGHLFWECNEVIEFWENVKEWCANKCKLHLKVK